MKYTAIQRHELEKEFVVKLANYEGWQVNFETVHSSKDPKVQRTLELSRKLLDAVEQAIS
ncbi:hypothetical protein BV378_20145 [Nostoc sp. RF31YmG]|jgi:outer membrane biogenesis lipoprotein LolB|nr:hypothetical protein BV378_20145 [Nostoc sp. RF31YmG]